MRREDPRSSSSWQQIRAVERDSIANKKAYAERWGYHLEIKDMSTKKRYAHEWRESWEKVDVIKQTMRQHPKAEWWVSTALFNHLGMC